jgi:hypothetical protein
VRPLISSPVAYHPPSQFLFPRGSPAFVKILSAEPDGSGGFKVNGSMRAVDQESGADLDPTGQLAAAGRGEGPG